MPKALYYNILQYQDENLKLLQDNFDLKILENPTEDTDELLSDIDVVFAPLGFKCDKNKIDKMPNLKVIASNTTGEPHIDREYANSRGIAVFSLKDDQEFLSTITPTAEHAWGLLLSLMRRIPWAYQSVLYGEWDRRLFGGKSMLSRMTIGIVGFGRLGSIVADYAKAFRMKEICFFDPSVSENKVEGVKRAKSLEELLENSDVVTVHIPATPENSKLFSKKIFNSFKKGSFFINTSRAEVVDEFAMIEALKEKILAGAAVDVFDGEFELNHNELLQKSLLLEYAKEHDNLLITPHIGGSTYDAWRLTERRIIDKIIYHFNKNN